MLSNFFMIGTIGLLCGSLLLVITGREKESLPQLLEKLTYLNNDCIYIEEIRQRMSKEIELNLIKTPEQLKTRFSDLALTYNYNVNLELLKR